MVPVEGRSGLGAPKLAYKELTLCETECEKVQASGILKNNGVVFKNLFLLFRVLQMPPILPSIFASLHRAPTSP